MEIMVNYRNYYSPVLTRAVEICDHLIAFFKTEQMLEKGRFSSAIAETETVRRGILERLATPKYLKPSEFSSVVGFMAFYDNHATNNYGVSLPAEKLAYRDQLMTAWINEVVEPLIKLMNQLEEEA